MKNMSSINNKELSCIIEAFKKLHYITHEGIYDKDIDLERYNKRKEEFNSGPFSFRLDELGLIRFGTLTTDYAFFNTHGVCIPNNYGKMCATFLKAIETDTIQQLSKTDMFEIFKTL